MRRLEQLRIDAFLTREELAEKTGVGARTIERLEQGKTVRPHIKTLRPLAEFFEVPASELMPEVQESAA